MIRGEIWTQSGGAGYTGKPRPAVILQTDLITDTGSVITCGLTTHRSPTLRSRPPVEPDASNGLHERSEVMIDKISAIAREKLDSRLGSRSDDDMARVDQALLLVLVLEW